MLLLPICPEQSDPGSWHWWSVVSGPTSLGAPALVSLTSPCPPGQSHPMSPRPLASQLSLGPGTVLESPQSPLVPSALPPRRSPVLRIPPLPPHPDDIPHCRWLPHLGLITHSLCLKSESSLACHLQADRHCHPRLPRLPELPGNLGTT